MQVFQGLGGKSQAIAVLAYLQARDGLECSWNKEYLRYDADPRVAEWYNGREQGYVLYMRSKGYSDQLNIAFFEHRNSDAICAVMWEGFTSNPPTLADIPKDHPYHDSKYGTSHDVRHGEASDMADWIMSQMQEFWIKTANEV